MNLKPELKNSFFIIVFFLSNYISGQSYAPPVGQAGTSAMHKDSLAFINWANACSVTRGFQDISSTVLGFTYVGDSTMATGKAQTNPIVSLGDGGSAICRFAKPIMNGTGHDFAVFENSFDDTFLELAFVEVSSDGINFVRFPAHSLTDTTIQTSSFGSTDATKINNLAGKYRGGYGTPFDLAELAGKPNLDINAITHVKIIDVVGSIQKQYATYDSYGNKVNDPWPTAFPSGGFDLDAVGVIHENTSIGIPENDIESSITVYPNPVEGSGRLLIRLPFVIHNAALFDVSGRQMLVSGKETITLEGLSSGIYVLQIWTEKGSARKKVLVN